MSHFAFAIRYFLVDFRLATLRTSTHWLIAYCTQFEIVVRKLNQYRSCWDGICVTTSSYLGGRSLAAKINIKLTNIILW